MRIKMITRRTDPVLENYAIEWGEFITIRLKFVMSWKKSWHKYTELRLIGCTHPIVIDESFDEFDRLMRFRERRR